MNPADESSKLGLKPYVAAMAAFLRHPLKESDGSTTPIQTVSIEGGWGAGKSTFADEVADELRSQGVPVVEFKPWLHVETEDLWIALASTFHRDIKNHLSRRKYLWRMVGLFQQRHLCCGHKNLRTRYTGVFYEIIVGSAAFGLIPWIFLAVQIPLEV